MVTRAAVDVNGETSAARRRVNHGERGHNRRRLILKKKNPPGRRATERVRERVARSTPSGHHMAVSVVAVELRGGRPAGGRAAAAVSDLSAVAVGWGGYWRWLRAPLLVERIWIRRARCSACRRSHALLPDLVLARRLDAVEVIGRGLALKLIERAGAAADRRAARRAAHDGSVVVATFPRAVARRCWPSARRWRWRWTAPRSTSACESANAPHWRRWASPGSEPWLGSASASASLWSFWSRISGGQALGTNTTSPWARGSGSGLDGAISIGRCQLHDHRVRRSHRVVPLPRHRRGHQPAAQSRRTRPARARAGAANCTSIRMAASVSTRAARSTAGFAPIASRAWTGSNPTRAPTWARSAAIRSCWTKPARCVSSCPLARPPRSARSCTPAIASASPSAPSASTCSRRGLQRAALAGQPRAFGRFEATARTSCGSATCWSVRSCLTRASTAAARLPLRPGRRLLAPAAARPLGARSEHARRPGRAARRHPAPRSARAAVRR